MIVFYFYCLVYAHLYYLAYFHYILLALHRCTIYVEAMVSSLFYLLLYETDLDIGGSTMENHASMIELSYLFHFVGCGMPALDGEKPKATRVSSHLQPYQYVLSETIID